MEGQPLGPVLESDRQSTDLFALSFDASAKEVTGSVSDDVHVFVGSDQMSWIGGTR